jgi:hypothetical protein
MTKPSLAGAALCALLCLVPPVLEAAGPPHAKIHRSLRPEPGQPAGCIAGSIGKASPGNAAFYVTLNIQGGAKQKYVSFIWDGMEGTIFMQKKAALREGDESRDAFLACVKPGRYTLHSTVISMGAATFSLPGSYDIPFEVQAGQTRYIGSFVAYPAFQADPCGKRLGELRVVARDRSDTDLAALSALEPSNPFPVVVDPVVKQDIYPVLLTCPGPAVSATATQSQ